MKAAIQADPDDLQQRLVFADWLEEHDDPRAELLRLGVAMEPVRYCPRERLAVALRGQIKAWKKRYLASWLAVKPAGLSVELDRGLMTWHINLGKWRNILKRPELRQLLETGWVEWIDIRIRTPQQWELVRADWPALSAWTRLSLYRRFDVGGGLTTLDELPRIIALCVPTLAPCSAAELETVGGMTDLRDLQMPQTSAEALTALRRLPRLQSLVFSQDESFGDDHVRAVGAHPHLRSLFLTPSHSLSDAGLVTLAGMPRMRALFMGCPHHVTRTGLEQVAGLRELRYLNLSGSQNLHAEDLATLTRLTELRSLWLNHCAWPTDAGLEQLRPLVQMEELMVHACPGVSDSAVRRLKLHWRKAQAARGNVAGGT